VKCSDGFFFHACGLNKKEGRKGGKGKGEKRGEKRRGGNELSTWMM
jgi:hypothetical protein